MIFHLTEINKFYCPPVSPGLCNNEEAASALVTDGFLNNLKQPT